MYLALDSHEQEIANAAADFLSNEFPLQRLHATPQDPKQLPAFAELGWLGLTAPEAVGGIGLSVVEEMLFFQELGRVIGPVSVFSQIIAVSAAQQEPELCGSLIAGEEDVALLVDSSDDNKIRLIGDQHAKYAVALNAAGATLYALSAENAQTVPCLDRSVGMFVGPSSIINELCSHSDPQIWQRMLINTAAMQVGLAETALQMIVDYARERKTFGRAIGSYQAVRHPCSDMAVRVEGARSQVFYAATALKEQHADVDMQISAAVLLAERAAKANVDSNIQLHGGIGVTDEHDAHLLMKRANLVSRLLGTGKALNKHLLQVEEN